MINIVKPVNLPKFILNKHYKKLTPKQGKNKYKFVTLEDIEIIFDLNLIPSRWTVEYKDGSGRTWMTITTSSIKIHKGYAWNGCTPSIPLGKFWFGTPDFKKTVMASLVHDSLRQFETTEHHQFSRYIEDQIFHSILKANGFNLRDIYYFGVRIGSNTILIKGSTNYSVLTIDESVHSLNI